MSLVRYEPMSGVQSYAGGAIGSIGAQIGSRILRDLGEQTYTFAKRKLSDVFNEGFNKVRIMSTKKNDKPSVPNFMWKPKTYQKQLYPGTYTGKIAPYGPNQQKFKQKCLKKGVVFSRESQREYNQIDAIVITHSYGRKEMLAVYCTAVIRQMLEKKFDRQFSSVDAELQEVVIIPVGGTVNFKIKYYRDNTSTLLDIETSISYFMTATLRQVGTDMAARLMGIYDNHPALTLTDVEFHPDDPSHFIPIVYGASSIKGTVKQVSTMYFQNSNSGRSAGSDTSVLTSNVNPVEVAAFTGKGNGPRYKNVRHDQWKSFVANEDSGLAVYAPVTPTQFGEEQFTPGSFYNCKNIGKTYVGVGNVKKDIVSAVISGSLSYVSKMLVNNDPTATGFCNIGYYKMYWMENCINRTDWNINISVELNLVTMAHVYINKGRNLTEINVPGFTLPVNPEPPTPPGP